MKSLVALLVVLVAIPQSIFARCKCFGSVKKSESQHIVEQIAQPVAVQPALTLPSEVRAPAIIAAPVQPASVAQNSIVNTTEVTTMKELDATSAQKITTPRDPELFAFGPKLEHTHTTPKKSNLTKPLYDFFKYFCAVSGACMLGVFFLSHKYAERLNKVNERWPRHDTTRPDSEPVKPAASVPPADPAPQPAAAQPQIPVPPAAQPQPAPQAQAAGVPVPPAVPSANAADQKRAAAAAAEKGPASSDDADKWRKLLEQFERDRLDRNELDAKLAEQNRQIQKLAAKIEHEPLFEPKPHESGSRGAEADMKDSAAKAIPDMPGLEDLPKVIFVQKQPAGVESAHAASSPLPPEPSPSAPLPPSSATAPASAAAATGPSVTVEDEEDEVENEPIGPQIPQKLDFDVADDASGVAGDVTSGAGACASHDVTDESIRAAANRERVDKLGQQIHETIASVDGPSADVLASAAKRQRSSSVDAERDLKEHSSSDKSSAGTASPLPVDATTANRSLSDIAEEVRAANTPNGAPTPGPADSSFQTPSKAAETARVERLRQIGAAMNNGDTAQAAELASQAATAPGMNRGKIARL
jgi:hypothetical protein